MFVVLFLSLFIILFMRILYWNCRGPKSDRFHSILKDLARANAVDLIFISEPKISRGNADEVIDKLGYQNIYRAEPVGFSGGIWVLSCTATFSINVLASSAYYVHLSIRSRGGLEWLCTVIYIKPKAALERQCLFMRP